MSCRRSRVCSRRNTGAGGMSCHDFVLAYRLATPSLHAAIVGLLFALFVPVVQIATGGAGAGADQRAHPGIARHGTDDGAARGPAKTTRHGPLLRRRQVAAAGQTEYDYSG